MRRYPNVAFGLWLLVACTSSSPQPDETGPEEKPVAGTPAQEIRVTGEPARAPKACRPETVGRLVVDFFSAVNSGASRITDFFAPELEWYSVTEGDPQADGRHFVSSDSTELREYFKNRAAHGERIQLLEIQVAYERRRNIGNVVYNLERTADDLAGYGDEAHGKGAIDCETGRILVWSMSQGGNSVGVGELCPGRPDPPDVALACASGAA